MTPVFLSIAGSDCSAGAGLQADLKTGFALNCYPLTAVTCVVSEVPGHVAGLVPLPADFVASQVRLCLDTFPVRAVKIGMLYSPEIVRAVAETLRDFSGSIVVDPVMIATAGEALMLQEAIATYETCLFPTATLITPNLDEAAALLQAPCPRTEEEMREAALNLSAHYQCTILAKGGHLQQGRSCIDILATPEGACRSWRHPRVEHISTHGTGCTLSSAICAGLAHQLPLEQAVEQGLSYVAHAIAHSHRFPSVDALNHHRG